MGHEVYISYSMKDKNAVLRLCDEFEKEKIDFFLDHLKLSGGLVDPKTLGREIRNCKVFLFIGSENSYKTRFTYTELKYALKNKGQTMVLPYIIDGSTPPGYISDLFRCTLFLRQDTKALIGKIFELLGRKKVELTARDWYNKGVNCANKKDYAQATEYYKKAAAMGHASAQNNLANIYWNNGDKAEAIRLYTLAAEQGNVCAQYNLGYKYKYGNGIRKDSARAFKWLREATNQDDSDATYELSTFYRYKEYVTYNRKSELDLLCKAATLGHRDAHYEIAKIYYVGNEHVEQDLEKAEEYLIKYKNIKSEYSFDGKDLLEKIQFAKERKRIESLETTGPYKVGDYYSCKGKQGIVFEVTPDGRHGKIIHLRNVTPGTYQWCTPERYMGKPVGATSTTDGEENLRAVRDLIFWEQMFPAMKACMDVGPGWYLPAIDELEKALYKQDKWDIVLKAITANCGDEIAYGSFYWSSTEKSTFLFNGSKALACRTGAFRVIDSYSKKEEWVVRPIAKF